MAPKGVFSRLCSPDRRGGGGDGGRDAGKETAPFGCNRGVVDDPGGSCGGTGTADGIIEVVLGGKSRSWWTFAGRVEDSGGTTVTSGRVSVAPGIRWCCAGVEDVLDP